MNPAEWLVRTARRLPTAPALFTGPRQVAEYAGFAHRAAAIGGAMAERGIGTGCRVALFMTNRIEYLEAMYGAWFNGAAVVPINAKLHAKEAAWIAEHSEASLILTDNASLTDVREALGAAAIPVVSVQGSEFSVMRAAKPLKEPALMDTNDLAWLFYTSGTTGRPKGVKITAGNLLVLSQSYLVDVDSLSSKDTALYAAPMSHAAGIYNPMYVMLGMRHVVPESGGFDPAEIFELAPQFDPVTMFAAPTMVRRMIDVAKASNTQGDGIKTVVYAGGPMYEADIVEAVDHFGPKFVQVYGQGECPMAITALRREDIADRSHPNWRSRLNSVGTAQSIVSVRIFDDAGQEVPRGEIGEIAVRGAAVMGGYWRNDTATADTIKDGWLWTGDVGFMDADGYVTLQDRSKDLIISGGSNIYPREVEEVLLQHPAVREVAVVGKPHEEWGEEVVAFVVGNAPEEELDALCLGQIARFKRPKVYRSIAELPKNNYGKVLKTDLRQLLADEGA
ncbi:class I adenylate-forming enzyme family protein [Shimia ponticola]|uniref:class I adenylate-forming enzyme family protein n=1 Tax=Shimia ponticola TaxID=2582893 RepID=UPI0011BEB484|nr:AMP-binding protein [Shimia ponticola]